MSPLSPPSELDLKMAALYKRGKGLHTIAKMHGKTLSQARHAMRRAGVTLRSRAKARKLRALQEGPDDARVAAMYRTYGSIDAVCTKLHFTKNTVIASLRRSGVPIPPPGGRWKFPPHVRQAAVELAKERGSAVAAKRYGACPSTVQRWRQHGIEKPPRITLCFGCNQPTENAGPCDLCSLAM
jgi:hypothetical protein